MPMHPFDLFARASSSAPPPGRACVAVDFRATLCRRSAALNLVRLRDNQRASKTLDFRPTAARMSPGPQRHWQLHAGGTRATALPMCRDLLLLCRSIAGEAATRGRACTPPAIQPVPQFMSPAFRTARASFTQKAARTSWSSSSARWSASSRSRFSCSSQPLICTNTKCGLASIAHAPAQLV